MDFSTFNPFHLLALIQYQKHILIDKEVIIMSLNSLCKKEILQTEKSNLQKLQNLRVERFINNQAVLRDPAKDDSSIEAFVNNFATPDTVEPSLANRSSNILDALVQYIPTESVTLYVATLSAWEALNSIFQISREFIYWFYCLFTPILFFLIYVGERKKNGLSTFPQWKKLPLWKLIACTIAFAAWALAVPGSPYLSGKDGGVVAALIALVASTILSLLEPVFENITSNRRT